jgi:hypothetical protein
MSKEAIQYYNNKLTQLKDIRKSYEPTWQAIMDHIAPDLKGYLNTDTKDDGARTDDVIYDGNPVDYAMICATGIWSSVSSPSRPWKRRKLRKRKLNEIQEARVWTDEVTETDYDILQASNFYQSIFSAYLHAITIGTCCVIGDLDYDTVVHYTCLNVGEYWLGVNGRGKVDTLFRELEYNAAQLKDKFGEDKLPESVIKTITKDNPLGGKHTVIHVIEPDSQKIAPFKKEYVSAYYLQEGNNDTFLQVRGYKRKPFAAYRWGVNSGETYGKFNPGRNALGDCMQLQTMVYDYHEALQKVINPPTQGDSNLLENNQIDGSPGAFNPTNSSVGNNKIEALFAVNPDLASMWQSIQDKKEQISRKFFVDLFMAVSMRQDKDMTAEEVRSIASERMLALGAALENIHTELLGELDDILFDYAAEAGVYPEAPEEIQGEEINTDYISLLAQAQKMVGLSPIRQTLEYVGMMAQYDPTILLKVDFPNTLDEVVELTGAPSSMMRSNEAYQEAVAQQQQQQQAAQIGQTGLAMAEIAQKAGNIPTDTNNLMSKVLGVVQ